ncbi:MAG: hypothetical protein ACR2GK_03965 [Gemmatimonadaceae bacterium]
MDILAVAAEYYLRNNPEGTRFYVTDTLTARAFDRTVARGDYTILPKGARTSCDQSMEIKGMVVQLSLQEVNGDSAKVFWSSTCHGTPTRETDPVPYGPMGPLELVRTGRQWRLLPVTIYLVR